MNKLCIFPNLVFIELEVIFNPLGICPNPTSNGCWTPYKLKLHLISLKI